MSEVYEVSGPFLKQREDMQLTTDLMGGTQAMKRARGKYIPKAEGETASEYDQRVNRTVLYNAYRKTVRFLRGQVFQKPVSIPEAKEGENVTVTELEEYKALSEDVDKQGHNLTVWGAETFEAGINAGVTFCLIDYSHVETRETEEGGREFLDDDGLWKPFTKAVEEEKAWSPYFVHVKAQQVLDIHTRWNNGRLFVTHFRYVETIQLSDDDWTQAEVEQIRCFWPGRFETWRNTGVGQEDFSLVGEGVMRSVSGVPLPLIPLVWFMPGEKRTEITAEPALQDLAELNKRHWQATSDQYDLMEFVRRPPWLGKMLSNGDQETIVFGPGVLTNSNTPEADLVSRGIDAGSVAAGRQELQDIESQMAMYGLQLLQPKTGTITATEAARDQMESNSTLQGWALLFQDFLENAFKMVALWLGREDGPSVVVNTDFATPVDKDFLLQMYNAGAISQATLIEQVKKAGDLPDDLSVEEEVTRQAQELSANRGPSGSGMFGSLLSSTGATS